MAFVKRHLLLGILLAFAGVYHAANYPLRATLRRPSYSTHRFELQVGKRTIYSLGIPARTLQTKTDGSAQRLGEWGYELRYWVRQFPFDMVEEKGAPTLHLFHRNHLTVQYPPAAGETYPYMPEVRKFFDHLQAQGVTPVLVPVPTHLSIDRPRAFGKTLPPTYRWGDRLPQPTENARAVFDTLVAPVKNASVDLYSIYTKYVEEHPEAEVFVPYDFHWNSLGIALAAKGVVDQLIARGWDIPSPQVVPVGRQSVNYFRTLLNMLQLPKHYLQSHAEFQYVETHYGLSTNPRKPRRPNGRLVLAGTSYALAMEEQGLAFGALLGNYLGREVVQSAFHGAAARGGMDQLREQGFRFQPGDLFIYELSLVYGIHEPGTPLARFETSVPRS
jgi:hypothetical protein